MSRPRRLSPSLYIGAGQYFLTFCVRNRRSVFTDTELVVQTLMHFRRAATVQGFAILAYCVMPDHAHLLVEGASETADLRRFAANAKQRSGAAYALKYGGPLWQEGFHDRILRRHEDARSVARYLLANPVRAGLVASPRDYPYLGSDKWSIGELLDSVV